MASKKRDETDMGMVYDLKDYGEYYIANGKSPNSNRSTRHVQNQMGSILANLTKKVQKGTFDPEKSPKLFEYLADNIAKEYVKEKGHDGVRVTKDTRRAVARMFDSEFKSELMKKIGKK